MRTPVVLLTGVDPEALASALVGLSWDLPRAVAVRHEIDPEREVLTRTVSDATGVLEREEFELEHACVNCALREDIVPTLERLARDGRWESVLACLPLGAEAVQVVNVVAGDTRLQRHLRISAVMAALDAETLVDDLLGDDLLCERGHHTGPDDNRGVGEVGCALVEYADTVVLTGRADSHACDFAAALARPGVPVVAGGENLEAESLLAGLHDPDRSAAWAQMDAPVPPLASSRIWRLELSSPRPFHPVRLLHDIERLGTGRHRTRGVFWLPSRPDQIQVWDGSGGQLSIGTATRWDGNRRTHLLFTGVGVEPAGLRAAFEDLLMTPEELSTAGPELALVDEDGFEPWLGDLREIA